MPDPNDPTSPIVNGSAAAGGRATFAAGDRVAGRYVILRFIAQGGMGEVYEADDLELRARVALKTIRPAIASNDRAIERFKREILLARKVTHPGVCRIFDLGRHQGPGEPIAFFTMELLHGETLADRLRRGGRMQPAEALPIVSQMAAALGAAHAAGIVHRDFKSANVMLVSSDAGAAPRVVVTDFGLAHDAPAGADASTATAFVGGTPAYMSPEQVEGGTTTAASDVYALGVVMYEMLTGERPFDGDTPLAVAVKRLSEAPKPLRSHLPEVDPRWEAVVLRCLARDPGDRFARAEDVLAALEGRIEPLSRRRSWLVGAGAVLLLGAGVLVYNGLRASPPVAPAEARPPRRSVAVLGFKNLSGNPETAWLSTALAEMLTTELAAGEKLRTISGEAIARMKIELRLPEVDALSRETLARIRSNAGSDVVVLGSYLDLGGQIRLDLRVQDAVAGETIATLAETGAEAEIFALVGRAGEHLRGKLGVGGLSQGEAETVRASLPSKPEAARLYAEGLARLRVFDAAAARDLLRKSTEADPGFALAHAALAAAWSTLGYDARAAESARKAFELSSGLPREQRLWVEGRFRESAKDWPKAIEIYHSLFGFFPDNLEYGFRLATVQTAAQQGAAALTTVEALRKLPAAADDPRIDLAEAQALASLSDYRRGRATAARAVEKSARIGATLLVARARELEGWALLNLGAFEDARRTFDEASKTYAAAGDRAGGARLSVDVGIVAWQRGDIAAATAAHRNALRTFREIGHTDGAARALNYLAIALFESKDLRNAERTFAEALAAFRETGNKEEAAWCLNNIAEVLRRRGDLAASKAHYEQALAGFREIGNRRGTGAVLINIGGVLLDQGALAEAKDMFTEALAIEEATGQKSHAAWALQGRGRGLMAQDDLPGARRDLERAQALRTELGEKGTLADTHLWLAELDLEEARAPEAETLCRKAALTYAEQKAPEDEASAQAVLARALLPLAKADEARRAAERALALSARSEHVGVRIQAALAAARAEHARGRKVAALGRLDAALAEARKTGLVAWEFEVRLAAAEIALRPGADSEGRERLQALAKDAREHGFGLVARKAEALSRR